MSYLNEQGGEAIRLGCKAELAVVCSGFRSLTPPIQASSFAIRMTACEPCGETEFDPEAEVTFTHVDDVLSATLLQNCARRRRDVLNTITTFPWIKPAESGEEQLQAWYLVKRILPNQQEMLGAVASTLWTAKNKDRLDTVPRLSNDAFSKLPVNNARLQDMHLILQQHGLLRTERHPKTKKNYFTLLEHPLWLELAMVPHVQSLVRDMSDPDPYRQYNTHESYIALLASLREHYKD